MWEAAESLPTFGRSLPRHNGFRGGSIPPHAAKFINMANKVNDYDFYLFGRLYVDMVKKVVEYDIEYQIVCELHKKFIQGSFNNPNMDLYGCIVMFLHSEMGAS